MERNKDFIILPVDELRHIPEIGKDLTSMLLEGMRARNPELGLPADTPSFPACASKAYPGRAPAALPGTGDGTVSLEQPGWRAQFQLVSG